MIDNCAILQLAVAGCKEIIHDDEYAKKSFIVYDFKAD